MNEPQSNSDPEDNHLSVIFPYLTRNEKPGYLVRPLTITVGWTLIGKFNNLIRTTLLCPYIYTENAGGWPSCAKRIFSFLLSFAAAYSICDVRILEGDAGCISVCYIVGDVSCSNERRVSCSKAGKFHGIGVRKEVFGVLEGVYCSVDWKE